MIEDTTSRQQVRTWSLGEAARPSSQRSPLMSRLAMNQVTTRRWTLLDDVLGYREAGFGAIGVWRPKLSEFGEERGIELIRDSGLNVSSLSWAGGFTGAHGDTLEQSLDDARDAVDVAGQLAADALVLVSGSRAGHILSNARRLLVGALKQLGDRAGERAVMLAIQPMLANLAKEWTFLHSLDATLDVLAECDHPQVRMSFDVYQLWQEPRLLDRIGEIAPHVATVRLSDWRAPRCEFDRHLPGDGEIPLAEIVGAFLEAGYRGFFEVEVWSEDVWSADYDGVLRDCHARVESLDGDVAVV